MKQLYYNGNIVSNGKTFKGQVLVNDGIIEKVMDISASDDATSPLPPVDEKIDLKGNFLLPGFIDTHIHGFGGHGTDTQNPQDLLDMSIDLAKNGVLAFAPTLYPAPPAKMLKTLEEFSEIIGKEKGAKIIGLHLEGPFISPSKLGAMLPQDICPIDIKLMEKLYKASGGYLKAMTVAPELEGIEELAKFAKENKITLQAGHTDATYREMMRGADLGIRHITHLFNAMRGLNHRELGAAGAALLEDIFSVEIIADGKHFSPLLFKMIFKLKEPSKIVLITDSINPTGKQEGAANGEQVYLSDGIFKKKATDVIAGSSLTMLKGFQNLVAAGFGIENASLASSVNPARLYGLDFGSIEEGKKANFIMLDKELNLIGKGV
ncbi:MAG: N-acetylglucosamine-6-phosphate deacetylase [Elusimicrobiota bacterium]|jgi:N-acetylglucosamine-6-phosphate deacetylase|nr:N-acetylglucosamine-6-phosphate deacetylase [Elusimicrobiota bacterium]